MKGYNERSHPKSKFGPGVCPKKLNDLTKLISMELTIYFIEFWILV